MPLTTLPARHMNEAQLTEALSKAYRVIACLWCSPQDVDFQDVRKDGFSVVEDLRGADQEGADLLARFLEHPPISEEEYVDVFELSPQCALYLGSHVFEEPKTCAEAANSDRSEYMVHLKNIYRHFGFEIAKRELPDFLPIMVEFLGLTARSRCDALREKFIRDYMLPFLSPLCSRLGELKSSYLYLCQALSAVMLMDLTQSEKNSES